MSTTAATYFGKNYREATRKPGQAPRPGKTLSDQGEEEAGQRARFRCPECERKVVMRAALARADEADGEDQGGRLLDVKCPECEGEVSLEAPRGYRWISRASEAFGRRYQAALRERSLRHQNVVAAMMIQ